MSAPIIGWLAAHGLERHAESFRREGIGLDVIGDLSDDELAALGLGLGDRKRLARALEDPPAAAGGEQAPDTETWQRRPGERKPVTLLFADITGSTALTESLDAEDTHELLYGLVKLLCGAVERHRGTVCRFMGDGLMAMFGAPVAFEEHAEWACRAALDMIAAVEGYKRARAADGGGALAIRVGLHSGEVVVLRVGDGAGATWDASGPSVALAARMEQTAAPGTVQITPATHALVAGRFEIEPLPPVRVKGFTQPVEPLRLRGERAADSTAGDTRAFVGRRAELAQLQAALVAARDDGSGRVVYLRGEPGIGKSRLVERLSQAARGLGFRVHRTLVLDFGTGKGRDPIRLLTRDLLELPPDAGEPERCSAAAQAVAAGRVAKETEAHLCDLLDVAPPEALRAEYEALDAVTRARERAVVLAALVASLAADSPRLIVVEDLHWAPAPIRSYLHAIARNVNASPTVLAITSRIEGDHLYAGWHRELEGLPMSVLALGPLSRRDARLLAEATGVHEPDAVDACLERSGCNPLFLEQLLGALGGGDVDELPTSIATLVAARVDGLEPADREAVRAAAVLGQRFDADALRAVTARASYDVTRLVAHGLVKPDGDALLFTHALVQEAVLGLLLRGDRQSLHARAAHWYHGRDPVLFATHLDAAGDPAAASAWLEAARTEAGAMRFVYSRGFVERGLELAVDDTVRAALHTMHGRLLTQIGEMREAAEAYRRAATLCAEPAERCAAWTGAAHALRNSGAYAEGLAALDAAEREARAHGLVRELSVIHHHRGNILFLQVDGDGCEREQRRALALAEQCAMPEEQALALSGIARAHFIHGRLVVAGEFARRCVELARTHGFDGIVYGHLHMIGIGLHYLMRLEEASALATEAADNASRVGMPRQAVVSTYMAAEVLCDMDRRDASETYARRSLELAERVGERRYRPPVHSVLARLAARDGDGARADRLLRDAVERLDDQDMAFSGPLLLGALVRLARDDDTRLQALRDGRALRARPHSQQFMLHFYRDAIHSAVERAEWALAQQLAGELEDATRDEPMPLTDWYIRWARAAAAAARGEDEARATLVTLRADAQAAGLAVVLPAL